MIDTALTTVCFYLATHRDRLSSPSLFRGNWIPFSKGWVSISSQPGGHDVQILSPLPTQAGDKKFLISPWADTVIPSSHRSFRNFFLASTVLILMVFQGFLYEMVGFCSLSTEFCIWFGILKRSFFFFLMLKFLRSCSSRGTTACGQSRIHMSVWARSRDYKPAL